MIVYHHLSRLFLVPFDSRKSKCPPKGYKPHPFPKPAPGPKPLPIQPSVKPPVPRPTPHPAVVQPPIPKPSPAPQPVQPPVAPPKPTNAPTHRPSYGPPVAALLALHIPFDRYLGVNVLDTSNRTNNAIINNVDISKLPQACGLVGIFSKGNVSLNGKKFFPKPSVAVTIAMWVKLRSTAGRQSLFDTVATGSPARPGNYHFEVIDGKVRWFTRDLSENVVFNVTTDRVVVPPNQWTHLAGTYDKKQGQRWFT